MSLLRAAAYNILLSRSKMVNFASWAEDAGVPTELIEHLCELPSNKLEDRINELCIYFLNAHTDIEAGKAPGEFTRLHEAPFIVPMMQKLTTAEIREVNSTITPTLAETISGMLRAKLVRGSESAELHKPAAKRVAPAAFKAAAGITLNIRREHPLLPMPPPSPKTNLPRFGANALPPLPPSGVPSALQVSQPLPVASMPKASMPTPPPAAKSPTPPPMGSPQFFRDPIDESDDVITYKIATVDGRTTISGALVSDCRATGTTVLLPWRGVTASVCGSNILSKLTPPPSGFSAGIEGVVGCFYSVRISDVVTFGSIATLRAPDCKFICMRIGN